MLGNAAIVTAFAEVCAGCAPYVVPSPGMSAKIGYRLLARDAVAALRAVYFRSPTWSRQRPEAECLRSS